MAAPKKAADGGIETDTGVIGRGQSIPAKGMTSDGGIITSTGIIGKPAIGQPSSALVAAATPAPLKTAPAGIVTETGVIGAGHTTPNIPLSNTPNEFAELSKKPNTPYGLIKAQGAPDGSTPFATSSDWRISRDNEGGYHHVAPNSLAEEGHTFVEGSNTTNATDAMWKFRGMRNTARNAAAKVNPTNPEAKPEKKPNWWANLKGTSLDVPARLKGTASNEWTGQNYNALNRKVGDQQTSFTDMQARALPDSGITGGAEEDLHKADLLARGETEQTDVINAQGQIVPQLFRRAPQFEEDQTMSAAKERRLMARSRKWGQTETLQKQWRGKVFNKR